MPLQLLPYLYLADLPANGRMLFTHLKRMPLIGESKKRTREAPWTTRYRDIHRHIDIFEPPHIPSPEPIIKGVVTPLLFSCCRNAIRKSEAKKILKK